MVLAGQKALIAGPFLNINIVGPAICNRSALTPPSPASQLIPIRAPASAAGELSITFLDPGLRISRGDKGNLFVLTMADPTKKP